MRLRWGMVILLLVVAPTAVLSLLAVRALRYQQSVLNQQSVSSARGAVQAVVADVDAYLRTQLDAVVDVYGRAVLSGVSPDALAAADAQLRSASALVDASFLFMNPWGLVWPDAAGEGGTTDPLVGALRAALAGGAGEGPALVGGTVDGVAHVLRSVPGRPSLYAGYRINERALRAFLAAALWRQAGEAFRLETRGGAWNLSTDAARSPIGIEVSDSLDRRPGEPAADLGPVLATARLGPPLEQVEVRCAVRDVAEVEQAARRRVALYGWAVALLALGILGGALAVVVQAALEVRALHRRGDFLVGVSHDLRTPLAAMRVLAESLQKGHVREHERERFLLTMVRECDRLERLIERVLFLVRFGQETVLVGREAVDMVALARTVAARMQAPVHSLQIGSDDYVPPVRGDEAALGQVLMNLLDNAIKYGVSPSAGDGRASRLEVSVRCVHRRRRWWLPAGEWVCVVVRDYGMGLSRTELRRVFQRYYRSPRARELNVSGVGMGLALCRRVVRAHGGWIDVESAPGQGAAFCVYVPAASPGEVRPRATASRGDGGTR
jgi:signal transduction histidine kinase